MNNFFTRVAVIFVLFIIGYYAVSPYQNCMRDVHYTIPGAYCAENTAWQVKEDVTGENWDSVINLSTSTEMKALLYY